MHLSLVHGPTIKQWLLNGKRHTTCQDFPNLKKKGKKSDFCLSIWIQNKFASKWVLKKPHIGPVILEIPVVFSKNPDEILQVQPKFKALSHRVCKRIEPTPGIQSSFMANWDLTKINILLVPGKGSIHHRCL